MNILFLTSPAPALSPFSTKEKTPPLGLGCLISLAREAGHRVFFADLYLEDAPLIQDGYLQQHGIDFVAIYSSTICFSGTLRLLDEIDGLRRRGEWQGKVAVGGPHPSVAPQTIPGYVDFVVVGEGETVFLPMVEGKIADRLIQGGGVEDLDALPFQPWDLFAALPYEFTCKWLDAAPVFTLNTSRGCPFGCSFCSVGSIWGRKYAWQNPRRIVQEMEHLIAHFDAGGFYFREDHFTLNAQRTEEFCRLLVEKGWRVPWVCETRVDRLSEDLVALMRRAGCRAVYLGVESGSPRILKKLNKQQTVAQIENAIHLCNKYGILTNCSFIVGVPGETVYDIFLTYRLIKRTNPSSFWFGVFVGIPTSPLYREIEMNKLYEYKDDKGLLYLGGYDVKTRFFYSRDSREFVCFDFKQRTLYDWSLLVLLYLRKGKEKIVNMWSRISRG